jgi:hypothetical protein
MYYALSLSTEMFNYSYLGPAFSATDSARDLLESRAIRSGWGIAMALSDSNLLFSAGLLALRSLPVQRSQAASQNVSLRMGPDIAIQTFNAMNAQLALLYKTPSGVWQLDTDSALFAYINLAWAIELM